MAGPHQIWKLDIVGGVVSVFAGSGRENIVDGPAATANFAQPSGLATDGENLFVADSEVSGVRVLTGMQNPRGPTVRTIVGEGLFAFDDIDGKGGTVRLQHCLGLAFSADHLYIADTYNNKIKICEPRNRLVRTLVGTRKAGDGENPPHFYQPGGLSAAGSKLYVADTNNHKIKVVDLKTKDVTTLALDGLSPPQLAARPPTFPNATTISVPAVELAPAKSITLAVTVPLPKGFKLNEEAPLAYLVETPDKEGILCAGRLALRRQGESAQDRVQDHRRPGQGSRPRRQARPETLTQDIGVQRAIEPLPHSQPHLERADLLQRQRIVRDASLD